MPELNNPDPREFGAKPPFPAQQEAHPGHISELKPKADHGEESFKGRERLNGKAAIITGGDSGIGRAVAIAYAKEGADVVIGCLPEEEEDARDTARHVEAAGGKAVVLTGDIQKSSYAKELVSAAIENFGRLDVVVSNAAFQKVRDSIEEIPEEEFARTYHTNVFGTFFLCKAALPKMSPGGSIINTCSIEGYDPKPVLLAYASTKAALINFTKGLAKEAMQQGIRVNGVAPGPVWTPLIPSTMKPEQVQNFGESTVFGRPAQPVELAHLYVFLASDEASYVTGEIYSATGGKSPY